jgi:P27 family predicted phage terminase small subunit
MVKAGLLIEADRGALELYCSTMSDVRELEKELRKEGRTITTPNGCLQPSPAWSQLRQARNDALKCAVQLGLTPKARKTLGVGAVDDDDSDSGDFK